MYLISCSSSMEFKRFLKAALSNSFNRYPSSSLILNIFPGLGLLDIRWGGGWGGGGGLILVAAIVMAFGDGCWRFMGELVELRLPLTMQGLT